jgi:hypothetical protein
VLSNQRGYSEKSSAVEIGAWETHIVINIQLASKEERCHKDILPYVKGIFMKFCIKITQ